MRAMRPGRWSVPLAVLAMGCGGAGGTRPDAPALAVAGDYTIRKTVVSDTCGQGAPGNAFENPGTVPVVMESVPRIIGTFSLCMVETILL